jgi:putative ABC transport system substrate-binding protein
MDAFWKRMRELGYIDGQNLAIEARWAEGRYDRLPALMTEVLQRKVDVVVTQTTPAAVAAKNATSTVPIVVAAMSDPVRSGVTTSLAHPSGNVTGLSLGFDKALGGLELLRDMVPGLSTVAVLSANNPISQGLASDLEQIASTTGVKLRLIEVRDAAGLERAFHQAARQSQAAVVLPDSIVYSAHRNEVIALAARNQLPAIYYLRDFAVAGGLIAYAPNYAMLYARAADYVDRILKGAKPADLPIEQPSHYELVVNLKTARALGITVPESILLRADEVIK